MSRYSVSITTQGGVLDAGGHLIPTRELRRAMAEAVLMLESEVKARTPQGVGGGVDGLQASIAGDVVDVGAYIVGAVTHGREAYGDVVELGRRPGSAPPPRGALLSWLDIKGIPREAETPIRYAIARRGIKGKYMFRDALAAKQPQLARIFSALGYTITGALD